MNNKTPYIEVKDLSFSYDSSDFSFTDLNVVLNKNEIIALTGGNGTGKTTLGKLLTGILRTNHGDIFIDGKNIQDMDLGEIGTKIGYLFQNPEKQIFAPTVYEDICFPLQLKGISSEIIEEKASTIMKELEIYHLRDKTSYNISQGEKQRVALAGILVNDVEYLILDEPTSSLDEHRKELLGKILERLKDSGIGILLISHDDNFVKKYCTKELSLSKNGEISYE
jgi:energy-coupling factor transport system ATP-binding protein